MTEYFYSVIFLEVNMKNFYPTNPAIPLNTNVIPFASVLTISAARFTVDIIALQK